MSRVRAFLKRGFTSLDTAVISKELNALLSNSRVVNIYGVKNRPEALLFKLRLSNGHTSLLYIEPSVRINITNYQLPTLVGGRVAIFRRFLRTAKIASIRQYGFERIIVIEMVKGGEEVHLIIELIPRGIVSVVDSERRVLICNRDIKVRDREIRPGLTYTFPPLFTDPRSLSNDVLVERVKRADSVARGLIKVLGIPPEVVNEVLSAEERSRSTKEMSDSDVLKSILKVMDFISSIVENPAPTLVTYNSLPISFHPFKPSRLWSVEGFKYTLFNSFNEVVDEYFKAMLAREVGAEIFKACSATAHKLERTLSEVRDVILNVKKEMEVLRGSLKVLEEKFHVIEGILACIQESIKSEGWSAVSRCRGVRSFNPSKGTVSIVINGEEVELNVLKPLVIQYSMLRKRLSNLERKLRRAEEVRKDLERRLGESAIKGESVKQVKPLLRRVNWYSRYRWLITSNGFLAIGGRNAQQNEKLVRKFLEDSDIFMHADVHGASAFIIKCRGSTPPEKDLREVAVLAASYSKGWLAGVATLDVFWVWGYQVSKAPPPGQYLPTGSFMIRGKRNYIKGVPLRMAIGIQVVNDEYYSLITGPEDLVKERSIAYAVITPGTLNVRTAAERIKESLVGGDLRFTTLRVVDIEDVLPGSCSIVEVKSAA